MFAYNPTPDRSGEILGASTAQAANIRARGMENATNTVMSSLNTAMGMISNNITKSQENTAKAETNKGVGQAIAETYKTYGTPEQYNNYVAGLEKNAGNQDKLAGYNAMHMKTADALISLNKSIEIADAQGKNYQALAQIKADARSNADPKLDANYARQYYQDIRTRGYTHEQAIEGMKASGLNWGTQYIDRPVNEGFFGITR